LGKLAALAVVAFMLFGRIAVGLVAGLVARSLATLGHCNRHAVGCVCDCGDRVYGGQRDQPDPLIPFFLRRDSEQDSDRVRNLDRGHAQRG